MVYLYSGTPGSGKSYQATVKIIRSLEEGANVIANYQLNLESYPKIKGSFTFRRTDDITPAFLVSYAKEHHVKRKEAQTVLVIDECSTIFNSRDFGRKDRSDWLLFFAEHRKLGYTVVLITQQDRSIDRQIRGVIEYNYVHRKLANYGIKGFIIRLLTGKQYLCKCVWYPVKEKTEVFYFNVREKYYKAYDTFEIFGSDEVSEQKLTSGGSEKARLAISRQLRGEKTDAEQGETRIDAVMLVDGDALSDAVKCGSGVGSPSV